MGDGVKSLSDKRVAILVEEGFDSLELTGTITALHNSDIVVTLIGPTLGSTPKDKLGTTTVTSELAASKASMKDFDALVIPGGHASERMRLRHAMVDLVKEAMAATKPIGAISHGPQLLISANVIRGRTLTCWPSIAIDIKNAGGLYVDKPVAQDSNLITSRKASDIPNFTEALLRALDQSTTDQNQY